MAGNAPYIVTLGTAQDAGIPSPGCRCHNCSAAWADHGRWRLAACLGIVDPAAGKRWMVDCTPGFREQLRLLESLRLPGEDPGLSGVLLTHAHTGHYAGLVNLGKEMLSSDSVPVYAAKGMIGFILGNQPWRSLVDNGNISLVRLEPGVTVDLSDAVRVMPLSIPHRDELSETLGFRISGPERSVLYIPDIDGWEGLRPGIETLVAQCDHALLDGTFFSDGELGHRDMAQVPHPRIAASVERFRTLPEEVRARICFTHFNHTNPVVERGSAEARDVLASGLGLAGEMERAGL